MLYNRKTIGYMAAGIVQLCVGFDYDHDEEALLDPLETTLPDGNDKFKDEEEAEMQLEREDHNMMIVFGLVLIGLLIFCIVAGQAVMKSVCAREFIASPVYVAERWRVHVGSCLRDRFLRRRCHSAVCQSGVLRSERSPPRAL